MVNNITSFDIFMGDEVSGSLEHPLNGLVQGSRVTFKLGSNASNSYQIFLLHEQAPHNPRYDISWITADGQFMLLRPWHLDPDSDEGPDIRSLVKLVTGNAFELLPVEVVSQAVQTVRDEIESRLSLSPALRNQYLAGLKVKYLDPAD